jgi:hypothetical protein
MAVRAGVRGLGAGEIQAIRDGLGAGRRPRVVFTESAGQIAGQFGQVVSLLDPAESDEWVVVRFGRDELPFSPGDLQVAPRGAAGRKTAAPPPQPVAVRPEPEFVIDKPVVPARKQSGGTVAEPVVNGAPVAREPADASAGLAGGTVTEDKMADGTTAGGAKADAASKADGVRRADGVRKADGVPAPRKAAARPGRVKSPAGLTVTLAYADGEWTVAATQGSKSLARPYVVRPAEALRMVALVDVPGVREAVEQIMAVERAEAEQQAERLRAELAEIEARLAELRDAS